MSTSDVAVLRLEHTFDATPQEVFDAWTNPDVLARWWMARPNFSSPGCDVDLRVGGRYTLRMRDDESGNLHVVSGEYREIDRPHRLVYTWCWQGSADPHPGHVSLVTIEFDGDAQSTTIRLEHAGLPSDDSRTRHGAGWTAVLDVLASLLSAQTHNRGGSTQ